MTALSVWWRRNFGHRNDPPAMLPDPVTVTVTLGRFETPDEYMEKLNQAEKGWTLHAVLLPGWPQRKGLDSEPTKVILKRWDGAYRWRDDGFVGF